jgi:hypothetical protein
VRWDGMGCDVIEWNVVICDMLSARSMSNHLSDSTLLSYSLSSHSSLPLFPPIHSLLTPSHFPFPPFISPLIMSCLFYIILYHFTIYHIILYHITLFHITLFHIIFHHITLFNIILYHIISYHIPSEV